MTVAKRTLELRRKLATYDQDSLERVLLLMERPAPKQRSDSPEVAASYVLPLLAGSEVERLAVVFLDRRLRVLAAEVLSVGSDAHTIVEPRVIFRRALLNSASAIVMAHNHPSGDPEPSREDIAVTKRVDECGRILGITLLDHIVVGGPRNWVSLAQRGLFSPTTQAWSAAP